MRTRRILRKFALAFDILHVQRVDRRMGRSVISGADRRSLYTLEWKYIEQCDAMNKGYNHQPISQASRELGK